MNAVGVDVSKEKSTVAIYQPGDQVILKPRDFRHTQSDISSLIGIIKELDGETKVCMEHTGRYYEPVATWLSDAGIFVSAVNPILIKNFGDDSLRTPKTDKADAKKIPRYTLMFKNTRMRRLLFKSPADAGKNDKRLIKPFIRSRMSGHKCLKHILTHRQHRCIM